tara:strand:- start:4149 stop:5321 length:1173 start_codon:yes stop_codon:yes gene_type:complete
MIKLLLLSHDADLAGAERCLLDLVTKLDRSKFEPVVLVPWEGPLVDQLKQANVRYLIRCTIKHWIPYRNSANWFYPFTYPIGLRARLWSLLQLIEAENIDLVYTNTVTVLEGAIAARRAGIPHIWHIHEPTSGNPDIVSFLPARWVSRLCMALSSRIILPSHALARRLYAGAKSGVDVVHNGVDPGKFTRGIGENVRNEFAISPTSPIVTLIGISSARKDPITFVLAAQIVAQKHPNAYFLIAGKFADDGLRKQTLQLIQELNLTPRILLLGFFDRLEDLLAATTVHVSTSTQESFGLTLTEAMAAGKPVVATHCGGPEEVVADGLTGFVVAPKSPDAVANAILTLLDDSDAAQRFGEAGRQRVHELFTTETYAERVGNIITEVYNAQRG